MKTRWLVGEESVKRKRETDLDRFLKKEPNLHKRIKRTSKMFLVQATTRVPNDYYFVLLFCSIILILTIEQLFNEFFLGLKVHGLNEGRYLIIEFLQRARFRGLHGIMIVAFP